MADEKLVIDVIARDKASRDFDRVGDAAVKAGKDFDKAAGGAGRLQAEIDQTTINLRELGREFDRTGDKSLLRDLGKERRTLAGLTKLRREMAGLAGDTAKFTLSGLTGAIESLPAQLKGAVIVGAAGAAVAAAPLIGGALTGAIVAAVGSGAIAGGIVSAARSSEVKSAWESLAAEGEAAFADFGTPFVQPTIDAINILRGALAAIDDDMEAIAADAAKFVRPLAEGVGGFVDEMMPGIRALVREAGPVFEMFADEMPRLGRALGRFFDDLGEGAEGGAVALQALMRIAEGTLIVVGDTLEQMSQTMLMTAAITSKTGGALDFLLGDIGGKAPEFGEITSRSFRDVGDAAEEAGEKAEEAAKRYEELFGLWMDVDTSAIAVQQAIDDLTESFRDNLATLDINTEAGRKNASQLLDAVKAAKAHEEAMIRDGKSASYANQVFLQTVQGLYNQARAAGASTAELDALLGKYLRLAAAENIVKTITYRQVFTQHGQVFQPQGGGHQFFAEGGPVTGSGPKGVDSVPAMLAPGEFVLNSRAVDRIGMATLDRINSAAGVAAMSSTAASGMGGGGIGPLIFNYSGGGSALDDLFMAWFHRSVRDGRIQLSAGGSKVKVG